MTFWQKLGKYYPVRLELVPFVLVILAWLFAVNGYPHLPERIPTHFNAAGVPDGWGSRSSIFIFPVIGLVEYLFFSLLNILFAVVKDPKRLINLPRQQLEKLTPEKTAKLIRVFARSLFLLKTLIAVMCVYAVHMTVEVALQRAAGLGPGFMIITAGIIIVALYMVWQSLRMVAVSSRTNRSN